MRHQVSEKIGPWINEAIDTHGMGEPVVWEPGLAPAKGGTVVCCVFWMPGTTLGTVQQGSFVIHNPLAITRQEIDDTVRDFLAKMREARSETLAEDAPVPAPTPLVRGQQRPSGLLIG